jgi:hypothetical protein
MWSNTMGRVRQQVRSGDVKHQMPAERLDEFDDTREGLCIWTAAEMFEETEPRTPKSARVKSL